MVDMPDAEDKKPAPQVPPDKPGDEPSRSDREDAEQDGERRASADKKHPDSF